MNTSRIFNEVGELYQASIINEGKSRFPGIGDGSFAPQTNKKVVPAESKGPKAVSYTHLRAHETVLDLVCRLLLEKKKK